LEQYRSKSGVVPQDVFLFSESIRENLIFGLIESKNATPDHLLRPANFEKYVNQPKQQEEQFKAPWQ